MKQKRLWYYPGFEGSNKKGILRRQLQSFFSTQLGIQVTMEDIYWIGNKQPKDIVINLLSISEKKLIFQNVSKLKMLRNRHGNKYYFRDFRTTAQNDTYQELNKIQQTVEK